MRRWRSYEPVDVVHAELSLAEPRIRYVVVEAGIEDAWFVLYRERDWGYESESGWVSVWREEWTPRPVLLAALEALEPWGVIADCDDSTIRRSCLLLASVELEPDARQGVLPFPRSPWLRFWDAVRAGNERLGHGGV